MPLSEIAQKSLDDSAKINTQQRATRQIISTQQEKERKQAEDELNAFNKQQAELRRQITELENQEKAQIQLKANEEARKQKIIDDRNAINLKYNEQIKALGTPPPKYYQKAKYSTNRYTRKVTLIGYTRERNLTATKRYLQKVNEIKREQRKASQAFEFKVRYPGGVLGGSARRTYAKSGGRISLIALYEKQQSAFESKKLSQRAHAIAISKSQVKNARASFQNTADQFAQNKELNDQAQRGKIIFNTKPTKAGDLKKKATKPERVLFQPIPDEIKTNVKALKSFQATQQAKAQTLKDVMGKRAKEISIQKQTISDKSNAFLTKPPPQAKDIINDNKALYTFEETQAQQKELFNKITNAKTTQEATKLKEQYQKLNPYVGTPQQANTKEGKAKQGVLIDLKIPELFPKAYADDSKPIEILNPQTVTKTIYNITIGDRTITLDSKETADKILKRLNQTQKETTAIPKYLFSDQEGNKVKPNPGESFKFMSMMAGITSGVSVPSSKVDNYFNANLDKFDFESDPNDPRFSGVQRSLTEIALEDPVNRGILSHLVEPGNTPEGKAIEDVLAVGTATFNNSPLPQKSEVVEFISKKLETDDGRKELLGSAIGSYFALRIFTEIPRYGVNLFSKYVTQPKTLKIAEEIAQGIRIQGRDPATEKLIVRFPGMPEGMKTQLRNKVNKETVGIEMLDPQTALIKRGTELSEVNTPYIIVKTGKNPHSKLYELYTAEKPGAYKEILISGKQGKELTGGIKQTDDIVSYPTTRDNILKTANSDKLAPVGTVEKVGLEGMKERPLAVIEKIESQEIRHGTIILETQRLNKIKSMNIDVKGLSKGGDNLNIAKPKGTTTTGKTSTTSPGVKTNIDLTIPGAKPTTGTPTKLSPLTERRETLEKIIRATEKQTPKSDVKIIQNLGTTAGISLALGSKSNYITETKQGISQSSKQVQSEVTKIDTKITGKQNTIQTQRTDLISKLDTLQKTRPSIDPKYSLFVSEGLQGKQKQIPILAEDLDQITPQLVTLKTIQAQETQMPTPFKTTTTTTTKPAGLPISLSLGLENEIKRKLERGKPTITFFRYNVNTESVGRYIESVKDLSVGKTRKVISKVDRIQERINRPSYQKKQSRKEQKQYEKELSLLKKKKGSLNSRGFIPNISTPEGKQAKKQLKKLGFKLNIF